MKHKIADDLLDFAQPIDELTPDPDNVNTHDERSIERIMYSLDTFGQLKTIVINKKGVVRAGNGTLEAAKRLGWTHIAASLFTGGGNKEERAYAIADNKTAELSEWDDVSLARALEKFDEEAHFTAQDLGFDDADMRFLKQKAESLLSAETEAGSSGEGEWDDGAGSGGGSDGGSEGGSSREERITYTLQFDNPRQKDIWQGFLKLLKNNYPEFSTPSARLLAHIREAGATKE